MGWKVFPKEHPNNYSQNLLISGIPKYFFYPYNILIILRISIKSENIKEKSVIIKCSFHYLEVPVRHSGGRKIISKYVLTVVGK